MKILPYKINRVYDDTWVVVSQHFKYSDFGVSRNEDHGFHVVQYVPSPVAGTGFYSHTSESSSYQRFCRNEQSKIHTNYWTLLTGKEFSFKKELKKVERAMGETDNPMCKRLFETYRNCLLMGSEAEKTSRYIDALRRSIHGHHNHKHSHALKHYKHQLLNLEREIDNIRFDVRDYCDEERYEKFQTMAKAFADLCKCRRIWDLTTPGRHGQGYKQVFFDMGTFNYIYSPDYLPMIRDGRGGHYYIFPDAIIRYRSSVDFDMVKLSDISVITHPVGDGVQSEMNFPEIGLSFRFSSTERVGKLTKALHEMGMK